MRIDEIESIKTLCTGCMGCVDACPSQCISKITDINGFACTNIDSSKCVNCGKCAVVCPVVNSKKNAFEQCCFAAYAKDKKVHNRGSSGGIFEVLASWALENNYYVSGAGFDELKVKHLIVDNRNDLKVLLKSKYIQSDTLGIYEKIKQLLLQGEKVLFSGTPCQVSALKNYVSDKYLSNLILVDIVCHGVPSQKVFDMYIKDLENEKEGKISKFSFRVKDNVYKHSNGYHYTLTRDGKEKVVNGVYSQSSFYNAFKHYLIFRNSCYECKYATPDRVSDITLGDFWGIEKLDFDGDNDTGVSMVIINSSVGKELFLNICDKLIFKEFPLKYGISANPCLSKSSIRPKNRDEIIDSILNNGYVQTADKYFRKGSVLKPLFWLLPLSIRKILRRLRG